MILNTSIQNNYINGNNTKQNHNVKVISFGVKREIRMDNIIEEKPSKFLLGCKKISQVTMNALRGVGNGTGRTLKSLKNYKRSITRASMIGAVGYAIFALASRPHVDKKVDKPQESATGMVSMVEKPSRIPNKIEGLEVQIEKMIQQTREKTDRVKIELLKAEEDMKKAVERTRKEINEKKSNLEKTNNSELSTTKQIDKKREKIDKAIEKAMESRNVRNGEEIITEEKDGRLYIKGVTTFVSENNGIRTTEQLIRTLNVIKLEDKSIIRNVIDTYREMLHPKSPIEAIASMFCLGMQVIGLAIFLVCFSSPYRSRY